MKCLIAAIVFLAVTSRHPAMQSTSAPAPAADDFDSGQEKSLWTWSAEPLSEPLVTDRPDFTESTDAIPCGHAQIESGYTFTYDREKTSRMHDHSAPELLVRLGLARNFELRLGWPGYSWNQELFETRTRRDRRISREEWSQGANDPTFGFKYKFFEQEKLRPHLGIIGEISTPSGSAGFTSGDVEAQTKLLWGYDLTDRLGLAGNVNFAVVPEEGHHFLQTAASLSLAAALTDRWGTYVEYFGFYPSGRYSDCAHYLNGGTTYLITDNFQIDARIGFGLNEEADDLFAGIGFAWRW